MELKFIPLDYDYFDWQGRNWVRIIGRSEGGKRICVIDKFEPYIWAVLKQGVSEKKIKEIQEKIGKIKIKTAYRETKVEKVKLESKNFLGKPVRAFKIFVTNYKDAHPVADKLGMREIEKRRGYDINLITQYIIQKKIIPSCWYKISGEVVSNEEFGGISNIDVDICIKADKIQQAAKQEFFKPRVLAYDIEADEFEIGKGEILMISLVGENFKKVLTWKRCPVKNKDVECFKDEAEMIGAFVSYIKKLQPDVLVGYFSDGFDLPYLRARAEHNKMKLDIGIDSSQPRFTRGRLPTARISGIVHIDLFRFIQTAYSQYLQSETLSLNEVAAELIGETKKEFEIKHSKAMQDHEWNEYFQYNLQDSIITYKLFEKIWPDIFEFSKIMQEPVFSISRDSMSAHVENYILHNLDRFNEIPEKRPNYDELAERRGRRPYEGAFVLQPKAALYENLAAFDFTSMYASVIVSFNLSLASFSDKKIKNSYEAEIGNKKVYFEKKPAFFPQMLSEIVEKRKKFKQEYKKNSNPLTKARSNAYKLLANASYGYQGFFGARYYCLEAAASTAYFARKFIKDIIDKTNKAGFSVIYADTDGFSFELKNKTKQQTLAFLKKLNRELPGIMELELEDFYKRGIWVTKRTGDFGAKKKYALITYDGKIKIRGFETVRRDWCNLARQLQDRVIRAILQDGDEKRALEITKKIIKKLKNREIDKKDILIKTQLKKPLSEYRAISPHVIAAKKMQEREMPIDIGMLVVYFIAETRQKKKLVREKVKLPDEKGEYNIKYYIDHQIIPAVENIFEVFDINIKEVADGKKQTRLEEF